MAVEAGPGRATVQDEESRALRPGDEDISRVGYQTCGMRYQVPQEAHVDSPQL